MTKLLDQALDAVRQMPQTEQDNIAHAMLSMARIGEPAPGIDPSHLDDALEGLAQIKRGDIATDEEVAAAFRSFER